ncbi:PTS sugar transporter subunit IIA [Mesorhizobium sp. ESP7-2]|uniref:PTS sugar transporter subunit IIA n=1 Tax=Mesorhizobium sp. ESP7-2 TaxID=2876622 RepID=UPI001CCB3FCC|nr:PTS sugar transporter subunit IIA [Mesorhizobium sp. ESP7-2]MBZ9708579.1 PTS sugar transporter subunit IIA [Mesorhizobium sp. ESP7-2]
MDIWQFLLEQDIMATKAKRSALGKIVARLAQRTGKSENAVLEALLERERLGSTAMGDGLAMPAACIDGISDPVTMTRHSSGPSGSTLPTTARSDRSPIGMRFEAADAGGLHEDRRRTQL